MGTTPIQPGSWNRVEASLDLLSHYLDLFDRLGRVLDKADEVDRSDWTETWCQEILGELRTEFARITMPERKTIWQEMTAEQCLQPLWDRIKYDDLVAIQHELSRQAAFTKRVAHIGYIIRYWQTLLRCKSIVLQEAELLQGS